MMCQWKQKRGRMITPDTCHKRADQILAQRGRDTTILLNPISGEYFTLDEVGARIWELCDGTRRLPDLVSAIDAEFDAPIDEIEKDIRELLSELAHDKLL